MKLAGALLGLGVILAILPGTLGLASDGCGPVNCALVQAAGKVAACLGVIAAMAIVAARALAQRSYSGAVLAGLVMLPAVVWVGLTIGNYQASIAGSGEVHRLNGAAREYAAARVGVPAEQLRALAVDGKLGWAAVRVTAPDGQSQLVLLQTVGGDWTPRAIAPTFSKDELRALGAPTDLLRDA